MGKNEIHATRCVLSNGGSFGLGSVEEKFCGHFKQRPKKIPQHSNPKLPPLDTTQCVVSNGRGFGLESVVAKYLGHLASVNFIFSIFFRLAL